MAAQTRDPGDQLKEILKFKKGIEDSKKYLFRQYEGVEEFQENLRRYLAQWLREHDIGKSKVFLEAPASSPASLQETTTLAAETGPGFEFWIGEAGRVLDTQPPVMPDYHGAIFCAERARVFALSDVQ